MAGRDSQGARFERQQKAARKAQEALERRARGKWWARETHQLELPGLEPPAEPAPPAPEPPELEPGIYHPTEDGLKRCEACSEWAETAPTDAQGYFTEPGPCGQAYEKRLKAYEAEARARGDRFIF